MPRISAILLIFFAVIGSRAGELIPNFSLVDSNRLSLRHTQAVSPSDYKMQVFAIYFANSTCGFCRTQFERLSELQRQLRLTNGNYNIEILAMNQIGQENGSFAVGTIPWLQDRADVAAWELCETATGQSVVYRDVWIMNPAGELIDKYNLTTYPLTTAANFESLRQKLLNAARMADSDADKIPDYYEEVFGGGLGNGINSDADNDGFTLFQEFAFGTQPSFSRSRPRFYISRDELERLVLKYKRWGGNLIEYTIESSTDLTNWSRSSVEDSFFKDRKTMFDGSGCAEVTVLVPQYQQTAQAEFLRVVPRFKTTP